MENEKKKKARVAVILPDKIDFKAKTMVRDPKGYYITINGTIQQEDIILVNKHLHTNNKSKFSKIIFQQNIVCS